MAAYPSTNRSSRISPTCAFSVLSSKLPHSEVDTLRSDSLGGECTVLGRRSLGRDHVQRGRTAPVHARLRVRVLPEASILWIPVERLPPRRVGPEPHQAMRHEIMDSPRGRGAGDFHFGWEKVFVLVH
jgi:hypothetical protein